MFHYQCHNCFGRISEHKNLQFVSLLSSFLSFFLTNIHLSNENYFFLVTSQCRGHKISAKFVKLAQMIETFIKTPE